MSLRCVVVSGVLLTAALFASPAPSGAEDGYLNRLVDGPYGGSGASPIDPDDPRCNGQLYLDGVAPYSPGEPPAQSGNVRTQSCLDLRTSPWTTYGTFELVSGTGAALRGTHEGTVTTDTIHTIFTVTSGTREFRYATGTIDSRATYELADGVLSVDGNFVGSLVEAHLRVNDTSVIEGDTGQSRMVFRVRLSAARTVPVTVKFQIVDGSASRGSDYVFKQGTLTFAPGETSKVVGVIVNGDTRTERNETLLLKLFNSPNARITVPVGTGTILNDD